ncbi:Protoporphyrinogen oxidase [Leucobacter sp. BZR 635]
MHASPHVAVVGGGVAGLVAARELALAGARVTVFEAERELGGRLRATDLAGAQFDMGAEAFATRGGAVAGLLSELGLSEHIVQPAAAGAWVVGAGGALPLPPGGALGIPARPLSAAARRHLGVPGAIRAALEPLLPRLRNLPADTTVAALVRRRAGSRVLDRLVRPITLGVYSTGPEQLRLSAVPGLQAAVARTGSLVRGARELRDASLAAGGAVASLAGGMTTLVAELRADLERLGVEMRVGVRVASLATGPAAGAAAGTAAATGVGSVEGAQWILADDTGELVTRCDGVVLAVPEAAANALIGSLRTDADAAQSTAPLAAQDPPAEHAIEVIALAVADARLDAAPRGTGALVAARAGAGAGSDAGSGAGTGEPIAAKALTHVTAKWPDRAGHVAPGTHVLRLSYGRAGLAPETAGLSDDEAVALARRDASAILGIAIAPEHIVDWARQPWHVGAPPGPTPRIAAPAGIALAGDWVFGTGLASVIPGARAAATELLRALDRGDSAASHRAPPHGAVPHGVVPRTDPHQRTTASTPEGPVSPA